MSEARWLSFFWSADRQEIACDGERFAHPIATRTSASHDVAHLLAAASGLPWKPKGSRDAISVAEFNSVLLEHLGVGVVDAVLGGRGNETEVLGRVQEHLRWFVEVHYAPFPLSFEDALSRFCAAAKREAIVRLSPVFFNTRRFELEHGDHRTRTLGARFSSDFDPPVDSTTRALKSALARTLTALLETGCRRDEATHVGA